ncbi:uncharacterized protein LOC116169538 [Photinus pyralis]|uniref:uncharacterized protein LOC116169538 n=1 Tax=Photinus pyralis TaxID=7054 RepID=UPI001266E73C|nr:uncharacterized protein LOC116169538 [Photinus pyralis]
MENLLGWVTEPSNAQIGETIKQLADQLVLINHTSSELTYDTRTPPKIKQQIKKPPKKESAVTEHSHPGVVEPVSNIDSTWEENTKKLNFYKIENKPTTEHGLSTWVLLNSQTVSPSITSTPKSTPKPTVKQKFEDNKNLTRTEIFNKITKPLFKKRPAPSTTKKPTTVTTPATTSTTEQKITKIKASILNEAINNKNKTINKKVQENENSSLSTTKLPTPSTTPSDNSLFSLEPKDDEVELLLTPPSKKNRRPSNTTKKKKNKTRRRRPAAAEKLSLSNSTKLAPKDKPIGTQIYNYLSREIMPTVGVGLVGLMVTAGLASYFLYPFTPVRRSYQVDRKDNKGSYYYNDEYTPGGITEEEAIGKVIAGMPTTYESQNYRNTFKGGQQTTNRKSNDFGLRRGQSEASVEAIYLTPSKKYDEQLYFANRRNEPDVYNSQFMHKDFVTEKTKSHSEVTPVVVPEHGPRHLPKSTTASDIEGRVHSRKRRNSDFDNEIFDHDEDIRRGRPESTTFATTVPSKPQNFLHTLRLLFEAQIKLGLEFLQKTSQAVAKYFSDVHSRFNEKSKEQPRAQ